MEKACTSREVDSACTAIAVRAYGALKGSMSVELLKAKRARMKAAFMI